MTPTPRTGLIVLAIVALGSVLLLALPARSASAADGTAAPVLMVHGYDEGTNGCPGQDTTNTWFGLELAMTVTGARNQQVPVSYYACDTHGVDITGYGPSAPDGATTAVTGGTPRAGFDNDASPTAIAHDLAWFIYDSYSVDNRPVDVVALSMGGLLIRTALQQVQDGNPDFPPYLLVDRAVTLSSPHAGWGTSAEMTARCSSVQCLDLTSDSPLLSYLGVHSAAPQGRGGTDWTLVGSSAGCDLFTGASSLAMAGTTRIDYDWPCYGHTDYVYDLDAAQDGRAAVTSPDGTVTTTAAQPHSLMTVLAILTAPRSTPTPTPTPTPTSDPSTSDPSTTPGVGTTAGVADPTSPSPTTTTPAGPTPSTTAPAGATPTDSTPPFATAPAGAGSATTDTTPPTVSLDGAAGVTTDSSFRVTVTATDASGVRSVDVRYRKTGATGALGTFTYPQAWQARAAGVVTVAATPGVRYCLSARARDTAGTTSGWTPERCVVSPLDDRALQRDRAWVDGAGAGWFGRTYSVSRRAGASVTQRVTAGSRVTLVMGTCVSCGSVQVYADGRPWRRISTVTTSTRKAVLMDLGVPPTGATSIVVRSTSSAPVYLDGLAIGR